MIHLRGQWHTEEQLADIGRVAVESANLELVVDIMLADLSACPQDIVDLFVGPAMLDRKLDIVRALCQRKLRSMKAKELIGAQIAKCKGFNKERSTVIHGIWTPRHQVTLARLMSLMPPTLGPSDAAKRRTPQVVVKAERVKALGFDIQAAQQGLWGLSLKYRQRPLIRRAIARKKPRTQP